MVPNNRNLTRRSQVRFLITPSRQGGLSVIMHECPLSSGVLYGIYTTPNIITLLMSFPVIFDNTDNRMGVMRYFDNPLDSCQGGLTGPSKSDNPLLLKFGKMYNPH